jgi:hypothetical protein
LSEPPGLRRRLTRCFDLTGVPQRRDMKQENILFASVDRLLTEWGTMCVLDKVASDGTFVLGNTD